MGAGQEQQDFFIDWNTTGLTDVDYRVIDLSDLSILASGTATEIESTGGEGRKEGAYKYSFTPDANVFYYVQVRSESAGKYWAGLVCVGKGQEATIITLLQDATYGLQALDNELEDIRQKATSPSWNQDTDSLEAISEALAAEITREAGTTTEDTWAHPSGTTEQVIFTLTITKRTIISDVKIYTKNLTKSTAFRCFLKDNDGIYTQTPDGDFNWSTADPDCVWFKNLVHDRDVQFRMQSAEAEGASRDVPYSIIKEEMAA